jgi:redox-sensitive bicupin YhaK (pirin superfamily)
MEIFSYVLEGELAAQGQHGQRPRAAPGEIQLMSAGRGVTHSEFNPSRRAAALPADLDRARDRGLAPSYTEWKPTRARRRAQGARDLAGRPRRQRDDPPGRVRPSRGSAAGESVEHALAPGRGAWLQLIRGKATWNGTALAAGDGASTEDSGDLVLAASEPLEALLFDLG